MTLPPTDEVMERLRVLHQKLEDEGMYVRANSVWLAMQEIKRLRDGTVADMLASLKEIETAGLRGYLTPDLCADIVTKAIAKVEGNANPAST